MKDTVGAGDCFVGTFAYLLADYIDSTSKPIDFSTLCTFVQRSFMLVLIVFNLVVALINILLKLLKNGILRMFIILFVWIE